MWISRMLDESFMNLFEDCIISFEFYGWCFEFKKKESVPLARSHVFELAVEGCQVEDSILALFHPILFHR